MVKTWRSIIILWALQAILLSAFLADSYIARALEREQDLMRSVLGPALGEAVVTRADRWYTGAFVDTGIRARTFEMFIPTAQQRDESKGMEGAARPMFDWMEQRLVVLWMVIRQVLLRLSSALVWLPYTALIVIPAVVDGWTVRAIKRANVAYSSPIVRTLCMYGVLVLVWLFLFLLFLPAALNPLLVPIFLGLTAAAAWLFASNVQQKL